jgi:general stress protein 26
MINKEEAIRIAVELIEAADMVYVSTIDEEHYPQTRIMFNLRNKSQFPNLTDFFKINNGNLLVYLGTNTSSAKISQLRNDPSICLCYSKPKEFHSLMLSGKVEIVNDRDIKKSLWQEGWEMYYPLGCEDPDYTVLKIIPLKMKGWYKGQAIEYKLG